MNTNTCIPSYSSGHLNQVEQQQQDVGLLTTNKKKKCRGDRKRQRYRRQLHNQGLDYLTAEKLVKEKFPYRVQQQQQQQQLQIQKQTSSPNYSTQNLEVYIPLERVRCFYNSISILL
jgi:hypothetical protein